MNVQDLTKLTYDQIVIIEFEKLIVKAQFDSPFDDDNGLEPNDPAYQEYYSYLFKILEIIKNEGNENLKPGDLFICNEKILPISITIQEEGHSIDE